MANIFERARAGAVLIDPERIRQENLARQQAAAQQPAAQSLVGGNASRMARTQGLLGLGASLLQNSATTDASMNFGSALGAGVQAGMEGYNQGHAQGKAVDEEEKLLALKQQRDQIIAAGNINDPASLGQMAQALLRIGDQQGANMMMSRLNSIAENNARGERIVEGSDAEGTGFFSVPVEGGGSAVRVRGPAGGTDPVPMRQPEIIRLSLDTRKELERQMTPFANVARQLSAIEGATEIDTPAAQLTLINMFTKLIDDGAVVRDSDVALAQNTQGVFDRMQRMVEGFRSGQLLGPTQRRDFLDMARVFAAAIQPDAQRILTSYRNTATRFGMDVDAVMGDMDPFATMNLTRTPTRTPTLAIPADATPEERARLLREYLQGGRQ